MRMYDLILKKRNNLSLTCEEIDFMIQEYTLGNIPDYQMSAMMMAIYFNGMNEDETLALTLAMRDSGEVLDLSKMKGIKVDKHSTGGVGDKTSLALIPMVAACDVTVAKMSGRGLGHTGGTIDKLESFPGFHTDISEEHFLNQVNTLGLSIMGQTKELAPADKKLYALRDVTGTVDNMSLIASSIMSKKLASGADGIVLDVKTGSGAFMKSTEDSISLANEMLKIGHGAGKKVSAVITNMDQPLGNAVGNILEVCEAIDTLNGNGPKDFTELCLTLGVQMLQISNPDLSKEQAENKLKHAIESGEAKNKLAEFVKAQGGDESYVFHPEKFPIAAYTLDIKANATGYISHIDCDQVGLAALILGGGRETKESVIDLEVGIIFHEKCGSYVEEGECLATLYFNDTKKSKSAYDVLIKAIHITEDKPNEQPLIYHIITK